MAKQVITPSRRKFLGLACCAAGSVLTRHCLAADAVGAIDVHHHVSPPVWLESARDQITATNRNSSVVTNWTAQKSLDDMDANGVQIAMLSITNPGTWFGDSVKGRTLARGCNEYMAGLKRDHPSRFGGLASLPLPDADGSLSEIHHSLDTLKLDGFGLMTNYDDKWLGDALFRPVLEELNRRAATVYVHPTSAACCMAPIVDVSPSAIEFPIDTTRTIVSLLFSGSLAAFPNIKWIFSHAGGTLPMLAERITNIIQAQPRLQSRIPNGAMYEMRKLYYDLAQGTSAMQLAALTKMVDSTQIVFGSDFPFWSAKTVQAGMASGNLDASAREDIWHRNARRLFPTLT
jgi:predicted TIM-barrel fold metal-dependent hydrolase